MDTQNSYSASAIKLVHGAVDQLRYLCCFNDFVKDLQRQEGKLIKKWNDVDDCVKNSKTQVINVPVVHAWLKREANPLKGHVEELLKEAAARTNKSYCFVHCPNWIWRYRMAKKLSKKKVEVENCIKEGDMYIKLEDVVSSTDMQNFPSEKSLTFDSRKDAYEQLMEALKDDNVTMIGLYGMGGCGKTTMAVELKKTAVAENLFNEVHFVTVSNNKVVEVRSIQDKIAKVVQIPSLRGGESERAQDLRTRLTLEHKRILLILDDVWQELDFGAIGIPSGQNHKNCKILITTRSEAICASMKCQSKIPLSVLTIEEAWALFQKQAHISEGTSDALRHLARLISDECKGLPVAIAALAGTLKDKSEKDWNDALDRLKNSIPVNINEADLKNPYKCLRVSYDNLDTEEAKSFLLLCSVFPEDTEIPVEYLTRFAIGLGLLGEVQSFEGAREKVSAAKHKLVSSCLLSLSDDDDEGECVKMHDLVRDVALWIASEDNKVIKCLLEEDKTLECNSIRYLWCKKFPNGLDCSSIEFLFIGTDMDVSDEIFKGMERLKVLTLYWEGGQFGSLSTMSLKSLTNLRCLILVSWLIGEISFLGHMTKLECLMLHKCSFFEFPDVVVTQLSNLRLLHLTECRMKRNPLEVIGRHPMLEELYYNDEGLEEDFDNGNHEEFSKMFIVPQALRRYGIMLGSKFEDCGDVFFNGYKSLCLSCFDTSNVALKELAKKSEVLYVSNIKGGGKNIIPNTFQIGGGKVMSYGWIKFWLCDSDDIECLVDTSNLYQDREVGSLFPKLCKLKIENMKHLGGLVHGVPPNGLFEKLEKLRVDNCPFLTCLFAHSVAQSLVRLEKLEIVSCDGLKHILAEDDSGYGEINKHDHILLFSKLKKLCIKKCSMLEYIIPITFARGLVQLEYLTIDHCPELKYVFVQRTPGDQSQNELKIELPALETLLLTNNHKMIGIFPQYCSATWPSLHHFRSNNCPEFDIMPVNAFKVSRLQDISTIEKHFFIAKYMMIGNNSKIESIFSINDHKKIGQQASLRLQSLILRHLEQIKYICAGSKNSFTFQNLKTLEISGCDKLEVIFHASVLRCLPELQRLDIRRCRGLKQIIEDDDKKELSNLVSSQPSFPKLAALFIKNCHNMKLLFRVSASNDLPNLEFLMIVGAREMKELISYEQEQGGEIGKKKVELPKLELLVLVHLSSLCQGIELPTLTTRLVHDCPKLSLTTSIGTLGEFKRKLSQLNEVVLSYDSWWKMRDSLWEMLNIARKAIKSHQAFTPEDRVENHEGSEIQKPLEETGSTIEISQSTEGTKATTIEEVPASLKPALPTFGSELAPSLHKLPSSTLVDQESTIEPSLLDQRHELGETKSIGVKIKESVQESSISEKNAKENMPTDAEGNGFPVVTVTRSETGTSLNQKKQNVDDIIQEGSSSMNKGGEILVVSNGSIEVNLAKLEAFKHSGDLDDAQVALLAAAMAVYPHLWKVFDEFSTRFQAWKLNTLADMLFFLRNESAVSVAPQREKEFQELCNEAIQLGFDKSWVDEMRQRVMVRVSGVDHAQAQLRELTRELNKINDKIDNLCHFIDSHKKCFDFM